MRVIAGKYRRRTLLSLDGSATRPMLGRMRQTLFDVLQAEVEGCVFADLYAGTGAVGIEALSRGARRVVFVESAARAAKIIHRNLVALGAEAEAHVRVAQVHDVLEEIDADIFFLGPPYKELGEYTRTLKALSRHPAKWVIAQHGKALELHSSYGNLEKVRVVRVGANRLSIFRPIEAVLIPAS